MSNEPTLADLMKEMLAMKSDMTSLREENAELRARARDSTDGNDTRERARREQSTAFGSGNGGPAAKPFEPTGKAAWPAFKKFTGEDGGNLKYNDKSKARANNQAKFGGDKAEFHPFLVRLRDKFVEDEATFRNEISRMSYLYTLLEAKAMRAVEVRYASDSRPFSCVAEMIQVLESAFGNPNEVTEANDALRRHIYELNSKVDINDFIAEFDSLAAKSLVPDSQLKHTLWLHIVADLDSSLLTKTRDTQVTYEMFCESLKDSVYSKQRNGKKRQENMLQTRSNDNNRRGNREKDTNRITASKSKPVTSNSAKRALTEAEKRVHFDAETCFVCGREGHKSPDCPSKTQVSGIRPSKSVSKETSSGDEDSGKE
jgi:hypothetical protein